MMICGLILIACKEINCVGDGKCYVNRQNKRESCGDNGCISTKDVVFVNNINRQNCDCY
jgi:hypothetical protein